MNSLDRFVNGVVFDKVFAEFAKFLDPDLSEQEVKNMLEPARQEFWRELVSDEQLHTLYVSASLALEDTKEKAGRIKRKLGI